MDAVTQRPIARPTQNIQGVGAGDDRVDVERTPVRLSEHKEQAGEGERAERRQENEEHQVEGGV